MSKSGRIKSDLDDMTSLVEIIQILKDVASNSFYGAAKRKAKFEEFALAFTEFFRMVSLSEAVSPLVKNDIDKVAILAITWEGGFMADLNAKVIKTALGEGEKMNVVEYLVLGQKGAEKLATLTDKPIFVVENVVELGAYKAALAIKDRVIERVLKGEVGTFYVVYPRAKSLQFIKP
ncbi:MAG: F0F1 ATP synthase subunit gamma, partial [Candidatus Omnitrophica bacterium]|nr:F0F1 ATP synthase subunit gamma [Candidatus Omnitrophota bacterium]